MEEEKLRSRRKTVFMGFSHTCTIMWDVSSVILLSVIDICISVLLGLDLGDTGLCFSSNTEMTRKSRKGDNINLTQKGLFPRKTTQTAYTNRVLVICGMHSYYANEKKDRFSHLEMARMSIKNEKG
jgi:hypothetical protein